MVTWKRDWYVHQIALMPMIVTISAITEIDSTMGF